MSVLHHVGIFVFTCVLISGCASSSQKTRREQRDKAVSTAKLYCEFISGEDFPDLDVAVNLSMAQKCDGDKHFTMTNYKTPSEIPGIMYCCGTTPKTGMSSKVKVPEGKTSEGKTTEKSADAKKADSSDDLDQ